MQESHASGEHVLRIVKDRGEVRDGLYCDALNLLVKAVVPPVLKDQRVLIHQQHAAHSL